jgi:paraquat-inducible protein B
VFREDRNILQRITVDQKEVRIGAFLDYTDLAGIGIPKTGELQQLASQRRRLRELRGLLQDARGLVANVNGKVDPLAENLNRTISDARGLVNNVDQQVKPLAGKATSTMDDISTLARDVDARVDPLSKQLSGTLKSVESAFKSIDSLVGKDSPTRAELDSTLEELSGASRSLKVFADYLAEHPEALIKGKGYQNY